MNILRSIKKIPHYKLTSILAVGTFFCISLVALRILYSGSHMYGFLVWNLFLAIIPYGISLLLSIFYKNNIKKLGFWFLAIVWLLFFPNALYIVTDFIHLRPRGLVPVWYDAILLFSFGWNGVILAFASLRIIHNLLQKYCGQLWGWIFVAFSFFISGFGIYLGRFVRFNSWDVVSHPKDLFLDILSRVTHPAVHSRTYVVSLLFFAFFFVSYIMILHFGELTQDSSQK